ncbi:hypothetical protein H9W90_04575 [Polaribacter pectinis]|uniref:Uncharacterized protein n=1 Tax=Polaribacter pectinis TaxID=2738844 RepID=A0A7G9LCQ5_9FLAO|nr:hypothetical protein [Polaribacter pectinis]QNM86404.1 hypothetical protein H9W90_04575 [Polaribacter pectinis]
MKRFHYSFIMFFLLFNSYTQAQIGYRVLNVKQNSKDFKPLMYRTSNDSIGTGFGFVNPVDYSSIVFLKEKPVEETTKDWTVEKFRYVEIYDKNTITKLKELLEKRKMLDSTRLYEQTDKLNKVLDTFKIFVIKKNPNILLKNNMMYELIYENEQARLFRAVNPFLKHLYYIQSKKDNIYEGEIYSISVHEQKPFKRTAGRNLSHCPEIVKKIEDGNYFPFRGDEIKKFLDDYGILCDLK